MRMFEEAGCSTPAVQEMLGDAGITEVNMLQYLGILEQRTNEILQVGAATGVHHVVHLQQRTKSSQGGQDFTKLGHPEMVHH